MLPYLTEGLSSLCFKNNHFGGFHVSAIGAASPGVAHVAVKLIKHVGEMMCHVGRFQRVFQIKNISPTEKNQHPDQSRTMEACGMSK